MSQNLTAELKNGILVLSPHGRIDSANAAEVASEAEALRASHEADGLVLDADDLSYVSSAGLRVILRLRKEDPSLKLINVNPEVYDILEMTGFTEMMPVEKGYRKLSVEGCEMIGRGSNGEVYRLDPDTIIKVYLNPDSLPDIQRERELARRAFVLGIPTAIPYDVVKVGDGYGSVFELLNARSFTKILVEEPERMDEIIVMYVDLLKKIHSTEVGPDDMPDMKKVALKWARDVGPSLKKEKWEKLLALIEAVPENRHMIHGDYHTKNVMLQDGEALLIDMDTLSYGDPVFEFASIYNAYVGFYQGRPYAGGRSFIGLEIGQNAIVWKKTLRLYFGTDDEARLKRIEEKAELIGLTRILRRTLRRCDMSDPVEQNAVAFYVGRIEKLLDSVDSLLLDE